MSFCIATNGRYAPTTQNCIVTMYLPDFMKKSAFHSQTHTQIKGVKNDGYLLRHKPLFTTCQRHFQTDSFICGWVCQANIGHISMGSYKVRGPDPQKSG